jgi:phosphatidylserine/phosphatidylglycerophosphate/cardiolipin synthase-like enzyme
LQHNKVLIAKRDGQAFKILFGSTNFSFRGIYIQANNVLVFRDPAAAAMFENVFEIALSAPQGFTFKPISKQWFLLPDSNRPPIQFCFSPHRDADLSLGPIGAAIDQASSSVLFCIAFLNQATSGAVRAAVDRLAEKSLFSYGISDKDGGLNVHKPDGSLGIVDFQYLADHTPVPFKQEWSAGASGASGFGGIHEHHKFVVTDFNMPTAKVFTGSCNMSVSGEESNGDNLVMIEDPRVATSYAIEALRIFDHLHFRSNMQLASDEDEPAVITLAKPEAISGQPAWFAKYYSQDGQAAQDRKLFSH